MTIIGGFIDYILRPSDEPPTRGVLDTLPSGPPQQPPVCRGCGIAGHTAGECVMSPCFRLARAVGDSLCDCGFPASVHQGAA